MSTQTDAQVADVFFKWEKTAGCPDSWCLNGILKEEFAKELSGIIDSQFKGQYTLYNLDNAAIFLILRQGQQKVAEQAAEKRNQELQNWAATTPGLVPLNDHLIEVIKNFFTQNPNATVEQWHEYVSTTEAGNRNIWRNPQTLEDLVSLVRKATSQQLAELKVSYGEDKIQQALSELERRVHKGSVDARPSWKPDSSAQQAKDAAKAQAKQESDPKEIAKAKERAEFLASSLRISNNHAEKYRAKKEVASILITKAGENGVETDWFRTLEARQRYVDRVTSTSIR